MTTITIGSGCPLLLYFCLFMHRVLPVKRTILLELKFFLRVPPVLARGIVLPFTLSTLERNQFHHCLL